MEKKVCIVYHSGFGHTARQSEAIAEGVIRVPEVSCTSVPVANLENAEIHQLVIATSPLLFCSR